MLKRNKFNLSNYNLLTAKMGMLIPINFIDVLPGDSIRMSSSALIRMSPMLAPIMHPVSIRIHHWFVPYRLVWDKFEEFITGGPTNTFDEPLPTLTYDTTRNQKTLFDYFRLPVGEEKGSTQFKVSALPFRAYNLIWNEFYRDQDLQEERLEEWTDVAFVSWHKDNFTTARPWTQKGLGITVPLSTPQGTANLGKANLVPTGAPGGEQIFTGQAYIQSASVNSTVLTKASNATTVTGYPLELKVDATAVKDGGFGIDILDLRLASAVQRFNENRARFGSRYPEYLQFLGVRPLDARLQRPEFLGGGRQLLQISEVLQTAPDENSGVVGTMRGHGIGALRTNRWTKFFSEHGCVISLASIIPKNIYVTGTERSWLKRSNMDFFQPEYAQIGAQEVFKNQLFPTDSDNSNIFGYSERYDEYRRISSGVSGDFRSTLDYFHLGRHFDESPELNADFIKCNPSMRIFADTVSDPLWCVFQHNIKARRLVPRHGGGVLK